MNKTVKTILLTVLTLSMLTIALIELSGVSRKALFNKYKIGAGTPEHPSALQQQLDREASVAKMAKTSIRFTESKHNFGTISEGEKVRHDYEFTNTGSAPLMISDVIVTCGCTAPSFPKEPILPGQKGKVTIEFDSEGKTGMVRKSVFVNANTLPERTAIGFEVEVTKK
jgi:hypothetical protein